MALLPASGPSDDFSDMAEPEQPSLSEIRKRGIKKGEDDEPLNMFEYVDDTTAQVGHEAFWCYMCPIGGGCAWTRCGDPMFVGRQKFLCLKGYSGTTDCCSEEEGCISGVSKCCCIVTAYSFPPQCCGGKAAEHDGMPTCAICNCRCGGENKEAEAGPHAELLEETFLCYACFGGGGCGVIDCCSCGGSEYPMCKGNNKYMCFHSGCSTADCHDENGCCYAQNKICCVMTAAACPPGGGAHDGIPAMACCNVICCGAEEDFDEPGQMEMM